MTSHHATDAWTDLDRFLVLDDCGHEPPADSADIVRRCVAADGARTVSRIVAISIAGRAPKNDPAIFSLAIAAKLGDDATRSAAYAALPQVCRIAPDLMRFAAHAQRFGGWGRGMRKAVGAWFNARRADELARQLVQHPSTAGWCARDLLRLAHPRAVSPSHGHLFAWVVTGTLSAAARRDPMLALILAIEELEATSDVTAAARIIREHRVPHACVPPQLLALPAIAEALVSIAPCP